MTTTLTLSEALRVVPEALHLEEGEAFALEGILQAGEPIILRMERREHHHSSRQQALQRFLQGATTPDPSTSEELDEARFQYLRQKHLK